VLGLFHSFHEKSCIMGFKRTVPEGPRLLFKVGLCRGKGISRTLVVGFAQIFSKK
jgi:hypothetical protein